MLAPPGYAKIHSTPSRSSACTRMSLPRIRGPISPRWISLLAAAPVAVAAGISVVLLILLLLLFDFRPICARGPITKNPRPFPAVGSCRNLSVKRDKHRRRRVLRRLPVPGLVRLVTFPAKLPKPFRRSRVDFRVLAGRQRLSVPRHPVAKSKFARNKMTASMRLAGRNDFRTTKLWATLPNNTTTQHENDNRISFDGSARKRRAGGG